MIGKVFAAAVVVQIIAGFNGAKDAVEARETVKTSGTDFNTAMDAAISDETRTQEVLNTLGYVGYIAGAEIGRRLPEPGQPS